MIVLFAQITFAEAEESCRMTDHWLTLNFCITLQKANKNIAYMCVMH